VDLNTQGRSYILFPKINEQYFYTNPECTRVHNIIIGKMWIEHIGSLNIYNMDQTMSCEIIFKKSSLFHATHYEIEGYILDNTGKKLVKLEGKWNESLTGIWLVDTECVRKNEKRILWQKENNSMNNPWNFSNYALSLNRFNPNDEILLLPSDSRRRPDRRYLEEGNTTESTRWKKILEEKQRVERKQSTTPWQPIWFKEISLNNLFGEGQSLWVYTNEYWTFRKQKEQAFEKGLNIDQQFPPQIKGLACDFMSLC